MNDIFADIIDVAVVIYLDDILIYSDNPEQHSAHIQEVLHHLHKNCLYARADKCEFPCNSCEYLGYMLSPNGLTMAENKIKAIQDGPNPRRPGMSCLSSGFPNSIGVSFMATPRLQFPSQGSPKKMSPGTFRMTVGKSFEKLKQVFTTALDPRHPHHGRN